MRRRGPLAAFFAFGLFWGGWAVLVPVVQEDVGASKGQLGLALLFVAVGSVPAMLATGRAVDRHGARTLPWLIAAMACVCVLPAFAGSVAALAASLFAIGAASGSVDVAMNAAVSELERRRGVRLMQLAHALYSAGVLVGALSVGVAREAGAGRLTILAAFSAAMLVTAVANRGHERVSRQRGRHARGLSFSRGAVVLGIACGAAFVIEGGMENWGALFLERDLGAGPVAGSLAPAAYGGAMMLGRLSGQWLETRLSDAVLLARRHGSARWPVSSAPRSRRTSRSPSSRSSSAAPGSRSPRRRCSEPAAGMRRRTSAAAPWQR